MARYILNQKFDLITISVLRDITKIYKKAQISKMSRTFILQDDNAAKLLIIRQKNIWLINNQVT